MKSEIERLRENTAGERPDGGIIVVKAKADDPLASLGRVKSVLECIAEAPSEKTAWPSDEEWQNCLPPWFIATFEERTLEEIRKMEVQELEENVWLLWDYGSWLDAMRLRGWEWWSSLCDPLEGEWSALLLQHELVYSIQPLIYLARESGALSVEVTEE